MILSLPAASTEAHENVLSGQKKKKKKNGRPGGPMELLALSNAEWMNGGNETVRVSKKTEGDNQLSEDQ